jgi:predicted Zn-dependent protease
MNVLSARTTLLAFLCAATLVLSAGCKSIEDALLVGTQVLAENIELVDEEDRGRVLAGIKSVQAMLSDIGVDEEIAIGQSLAVRVFMSYGRPVQDPMLTRYVALVGKTVALQSARPGLPYHFAVIQSDTPNALALPGGYIFITTALLKRLNSEHELAAVLGHEIAHVAEKHALRIILRDRRIAALVDFAQEMDKNVAQYRQFVDMSYDKLAHEGYDQTFEIAADLAGTNYAYMAGYHPEGLLPFLQESARSQGALAFETFKTHPDPNTRIRKLKDALSSLPMYSSMPKLSDRYRREALDRLLSGAIGL